MSIDLQIINDRDVGKRFDEFPQVAHSKLFARITALTDQLAARVEAAEPVKTGALRSETRTQVTDRPERIRGRVFIDGAKSGDFAKAAALEYGAHNATSVKAHSQRLSHIFGRLVDPRQVFVSAYTRSPNIKADEFLRGPLADMATEIIDGMQEALNQAIAETSA